MAKAHRTKKFAAVKRLLNPKDTRLKTAQKEKEKKRKELLKPKTVNDEEITEKAQEPSHMFFKHNTALGPPYRILLDTNFVNFSIQNKIDIFKGSMDCLVGKCRQTTIVLHGGLNLFLFFSVGIPFITDCVIAELEKLGHKYRLALKLTKDPRFQKLTCTHQGSYADDCIVNRVKESRTYIVGTCDKDLKRRIRKIPGVPIMFISNHKYTIERMPEAFSNM